MTEHTSPSSGGPPTIVLLHGAWVGPSCWDGFRARLEARGHRTLAPSWPFDDRPIDDLRRSPDPALAQVGVAEIVEHYAAVVRELPSPPVLVGHSFGGLFVQLLLDRGLGAAGVAIDSAPPRGILPSWSAIKASAHVLTSPGSWRKTLRMSYEAFRWGFGHTLSEPQARAAYEQHVIPTPGRPFWQAAFGPFVDALRVSFRREGRAPLLLVAGGADRTVTPAMNRANHRRYQGSTSATDFHEFPGRSHWIIAEPGWEEVADYTADWIGRQQASAPS